MTCWAAGTTSPTCSHAADVCVLPSRWEARSLTAQEALRIGTPLVATRTGGLPELLGDAAELVPVGNSAALADAVVRVLTDREHAERLVEAGRRQAATWPDEAGTARQLVDLYRELLGPGTAPMTRAGRRAAALLALVAGLLAGPLPVAGAADDRAGAATDADRVLVVGVPGLTWADVDPEATPELWALAEESAIGAVSVRAARSTTCLLDGWATLGAGNRARVPGPDEGLPPVPLPTVPLAGDPAAPRPPPRPRRRAGAGPGHHAGPLRPPGAGRHVRARRSRRRRRAHRRRRGHRPVRRRARRPGWPRSAAPPCRGRAATLAVAAPEWRITRADTLPSEPAELAGLLAGCPLALVSLDQLTDAGEPGPRKTDDGTEPALRAEALTEIDADVGRLRAAVADSAGRHAADAGRDLRGQRRPLPAARRDGLRSGFPAPAWLSSPSTGPGALRPADRRRAHRAARPRARRAPVDERRPAAGERNRPALPAAVAELDRLNTSATVHHRNTGAFFWSSVGWSRRWSHSACGSSGCLRGPGRRPPALPGDGSCGRRPSPSRPSRSRRTSPAWPRGNGREPRALALTAAVLVADLGRVRRRLARALATAPLRPAADRARGDVRDPGRGRAHGIPSGARRAAGLRRDRRRPLHRVRQPQLRAARRSAP